MYWLYKLSFWGIILLKTEANLYFSQKTNVFWKTVHKNILCSLSLH